MAFDFTPINYGAQLGLDQLSDPRVLSLQRQQLELSRRAQQQQVVAAQAKAQQQQRYDEAVSAYLRNPTVEGAAALLAQFPDQAAAIKTAWETRSKDQQKADFQDLTKIYGFLRNDRVDDAKKAVQDRIEAKRQAGVPVDEETALLAAIDANPKGASGQAGLSMSAIGGPEKFAQIQEALRLGGKGNEGFTLSQGQTRYDADGNPIASLAPKPDYLVIPEGGTAVPLNGAPAIQGGGGPVSGGAGVAPGAPAGRTVGGWTPRARNGGDNSDAAVDGKISGMAAALQIAPTAPFPPGMSNMEIAKALALSEGGAGSLADRNNNPGNLRDSSGGYRKFPTKEAGLAAAAAQVARNRARGQNTIQTMVEGLPASAQQSGSNPPGTLYGRPKRGYRVLSPEEVPQGLDPSVVYQQGPDGNITPIGGQKQGQLKPWPVQALQARTENSASIQNIDNALWLLDPKNIKDERVRNARGAVGFGTGAFWDPNRTDPKGAEFRALIGQIGGTIIKDISGAAVSATEDDRLKKWVPYPTDSVATIQAKLKNLRREIAQRNAVMDQTYSADQGYRSFGQKDAPVRVRSVQEARALPPGTVFITPDGRRKVR